MTQKEYKNVAKELIKSCLTFNPKNFTEFLKNKEIKVNTYNKAKFYKFFKHMIYCMENNSDKNISYKWKRINWCGKYITYLEFKDQSNKYPKLSIIFGKLENKIYIETLPI